MTKAYSYIRFSDSKQGSGTSERRQLEMTAALVKRHGWTLDKSLKVDRGRSAYKDGFQKSLSDFLGRIKTGEIEPGSVLVIERLDRLSRKTQTKAISLFLQIITAGVRIATVEPERIFDEQSCNEQGALLEAVIIFRVAWEESEKKADRSKRNWKFKREKAAATGQGITGRFPCWLKKDSDARDFKLIPDPAKVKVVQQIFAWAIEGYGSKRIVNLLREQNIECISVGFRTKGKTACRTSWNPTYIQQIIKGRAVLGEYQPKTDDGEPAGDPIKIYPQIIDDKTYYAALAAQNSRTKHKGQQGENAPNLFTGLLFDARTKESMRRSKWSRRKNGQYWYSLTSAHAAEPSSYSWKYEHFEESFLWFLKEVQFEELRQVVSDKPLRGMLAEVENKISALQKTMNETSNFQSLLSMMVELEKQKAELIDQIEKAKREIQKGTIAEVQRRFLRHLKKGGDADSVEHLTMSDRQTLKSKLGQIIDSIWLLIEHYKPFDEPEIKVGTVQLFVGEERRTFIVTRQGYKWSRMGYRGYGDAQVDLRNWDGRPMYGSYNARPRFEPIMETLTTHQTAHPGRWAVPSGVGLADPIGSDDGRD